MKTASCLLAVLLTASPLAAQAQQPKTSTDTIFHHPGGTPQQEHQQSETRRMQGALASWGRSASTIGSNNVPDPLGDDYAVSATSLAAPKQAQAALRKALRELDRGHSAKPGKATPHFDKAKQYLEEAVAEYPSYATAWTKLGQLQADTGDPDGAIAALEKSVELDEKYLAPYDALVWSYMAKRDWDHANKLTQFVLDINPADVKMRWYQAGCNYETGHYDEALKLFGEIVMEPDSAAQFPRAHLFMGLIYGYHKAYGEAAAAYRRYLELRPNSPDAEAVEQQLDNWQQLGVL